MKKVTTNQLMDVLVSIQNQMQTMNHRFSGLEKSFEIVHDAIGELSEKFTILDQKFLMLRQQVTH